MKNVVIIGAGPAGLTAAYELLKTGYEYNVTILEETNEIGGISKTVNYKGNRMDMGGHRFFSKSERVNKFWNEILPMQGARSKDDILLDRQIKLCKDGPDPEKEDDVMLNRNRVSRIYFKQKFFDYPIRISLSLFNNMGIVSTIKCMFSYLYSLVFKRKEDSLENFYINRFGKELYSMFFEYYTENLWGRHPRNIAADWGSQRVKGLSVLAIIKDIFSKAFHKKNRHVETSLIEAFKYPKYGPGQMWEETAKRVEKLGGHIIKNAKACRFLADNGNIKRVDYANEDNEIISLNCEYLVSSMPVKDLVAGMENVPNEAKRIATGLPYRDYMTVGFLTKKLNLKNLTNIKTVSNIVPDNWIYIQDRNLKLGRMQIYNNWSPYMVKDIEHTVWVGLEYFCNEDDEIWKMSDKEFAKFAAKEFTKMGCISGTKDLIDYHVERVKKAYPAYFDTYSEMDKLIEYLNSFDNLYCIGRNGQHRYNNMDHSMETAFEAVKCITNNIKDKTTLWNVNTEKEYHESK